MALGKLSRMRWVQRAPNGNGQQGFLRGAWRGVVKSLAPGSCGFIVFPMFTLQIICRKTLPASWPFVLLVHRTPSLVDRIQGRQMGSRPG
jgi:hypothetical protein